MTHLQALGVARDVGWPINVIVRASWKKVNVSVAVHITRDRNPAHVLLNLNACVTQHFSHRQAQEASDLVCLIIGDLALAIEDVGDGAWVKPEVLCQLALADLFAVKLVGKPGSVDLRAHFASSVFVFVFMFVYTKKIECRLKLRFIQCLEIIMQNKEPIDSLLEIFGTKAEIARICGIHFSTVTRWEPEYQGRIPQRHWKMLMRAAKERGHQLTLDDLAGFSA